MESHGNYTAPIGWMMRLVEAIAQTYLWVTTSSLWEELFENSNELI